MFPLEFRGDVNREKTRVMGLSYSEDPVIVAWVILTQCQRVTDGRTDLLLLVQRSALCALIPYIGLEKVRLYTLDIKTKMVMITIRINIRVVIPTLTTKGKYSVPTGTDELVDQKSVLEILTMFHCCCDIRVSMTMSNVKSVKSMLILIILLFCHLSCTQLHTAYS